MLKLLFLIFLYFAFRFVFRYVMPVVRTFNQIKKNVNTQNQNPNNTKVSQESLYQDKGEYIDYEEIS